MEQQIQTFTSQQFGEIRTALNENNEPLFCLADVCKALDINGGARNVKSRLLSKGVVTINTPTNGGVQQLNFITEPNLYKCIFQSRKKEAEQFQDWVCGEVLPSIRKTGGYIVAKQEDTPEEIMARAIIVANETMQRQKQRIQILEGQTQQQQQQLAILTPKAEYTDTVLQSSSTYTLTQVANDLGLRSIYTLTNLLSQKGIIYRQSGQWIPTAKYRELGIFATRTANYFHSDGSVGTSISTVVTESGRKWLHEYVKKNNL